MIRILFFALIVILLLSFFGVSVESIVKSPTGQANFSYVGDLLRQGWDGLVSFVNGMVSSIQHLF